MALSRVARRRQLHLCCWVFIQTQVDGTGVKWQMWGVIISTRRNAAVQRRAVNYTAAGRLRGWAGRRWWRRVARVSWNTTVKRYFNLNYEVFLVAVSLTRLSGSVLVHMWREGRGRYLRTITDCLCCVKNIMIRGFFYDKNSSDAIGQRISGSQNQSFSGKNLNV